MKTMQAAQKLFFMLVATTFMLVCTNWISGCAAVKNATVNSICEDALIKQIEVIAAANLRSIPIQRYVDGMCKIASIVEPFIKDPLKPDVGELGATVKMDPVQASLAAARKEGLIK